MIYEGERCANSGGKDTYIYGKKAEGNRLNQSIRRSLKLNKAKTTLTMWSV